MLPSIKYLKNNPHLLILGLILLIGLFFRTYQIIDRFEFAHDGDLYSWIAKDIIINHHPRLIGQLTSAPGIFIGPFFYYLLAPFLLLTNLDPIGVLIPVTIIGALTIYSYYVVLSKLFKKEVGLIGAFLYAVLLVTINTDRWVVPTVTTSLWSVWYFYSVIMISRGNFSVFPLLGVLTGLIWHIHIALIPTLSAIPFALLISRKLPSLRTILGFIITLFITSLPLIIFELKHNFGQTFSLLNNLTSDSVGPRGFYKLQLVLEMITKNTNNLLFAPQSFQIINNILFLFLLLSSALILIKKKLLSKKEIVPMYIWIIGMVIFFAISSSPISEYYFYNIEVIFLVLISLIFYLFYKSPKGRLFILGLLIFIAFKNTYTIINEQPYHKGYIERKSVANYIVNDAKDKKFPCFSINYITSPGENVGFRYFFFLKNAHLGVAGQGSPVYSIVIPDEYAIKEIAVKFGHIGIITPKEIPPKEIMEKACSGQNTNLTNPMFGYVE